tara:strand:+ start:19087 stop:20439 length:1353 start_codon:yes stop_codon:yes gene_type:complete
MGVRKAMSDDKNMIDFSNYDGDYQAGELLNEDGETVDLDELKSAEEPQKTPMLVRLVILLVLSMVVAITYYVVENTPPPTHVAKRKKPRKVDAVFEKTLKRLDQTRNKEFKPLFQCWGDLAGLIARKGKLSQEKLTDYCPPIKAGDFSAQAKCQDGCKKIILATCKGDKCTDVPEVAYFDFVYLHLLRYARGYNELFAHQRLYDKALEKLKDLKREQRANNKKAPETPKMKALKEKMKTQRTHMDALLTGKGVSRDAHDMPYFSVDGQKVIEQTVAHAKSLLKAPKAEEAPKKKKRRRRRRRRRRKKKKAQAKTYWGGVIKASGKWPVAASSISAYRPIGRYYRLEDKADRIGQVPYSNAAIHFWLYNFISPEISKCAQKSDSKLTLKVKGSISTESGNPIPGTFNFTGTEDTKVKSCVEKYLKRLAFRGFPTSEEDKQANITFDIKLTP